MLHQRLDAMDHVVVALFNPWLFSGRDELVRGFFNTLRGALGRSNTEEVRALVEALDRYWGAIDLAGHGVAAIVDLHGSSGAASAGWKKLSGKLKSALVKPRPLTPDEERISLEKKIAATQCAVIVLIDELDRIEDDEVRAVAQLVKAVGDIKGLSYLVAYDPERVVEALGRGIGERRRRVGELYLEKIIQYPIPLRPLFSEDVKALLESTLADHGVLLAEQRTDSQKELYAHIIDSIQTPREVKRLVGAFAILERAVRDEICPFDVLAYSWIVTKSPTLRTRIAEHVDALVTDPSDESASERVVRRMNNEAEPDIVSILGSSAREHTRTLELLFPRFIEERQVDDRERLTRRRNLIRMLYLGNPPGAVTRRDVEQLWNNTDLGELERILRELIRERKLATLMDRLDELLRSLPERGDRTFWVALSRALVRQDDWISENDNRHALADDASRTLVSLARRNPELADRLRATIEALVTDGDLVLAPDILRTHLFAYGIVGNQVRGGGVLTQSETQALLDRELPRYREAIIDGSFLRRVASPDALYIFANLNSFDSEMRSSFTDQLTTFDAISTLAALLVPPGIRVSLETLEIFFDTPLVLERAQNFISTLGYPSDLWIAESLRRLVVVLRGRDPLVEDDAS
ncbi:hypothetical protein AS026_13930 [Rhizobium altiplani]|uniref:KAP NTPase domain-containing protein n=2 Tax=Rhizobium altiplani TaxID=1864509 RepID=A0A109JDT8_9HYPH|nr:hypothetical protein AS026_13930 [Rhizobium altiplani]